MRMTTGLLGSVVLLAFAAVSACGGNDESSGGKGGSSSGGKGGSSSGGKGGSSGASGSSGGKTSGSTGGKASGGTGPSIGGTGFGGNFNPDDFACDPVPEQGAACEAGTQPCLADTDVCACVQNKWNCFNLTGAGGAGQIGEIDCPMARPMNGAACGTTIGVCPYGGGANSGCACYQSKWTCTP